MQKKLAVGGEEGGGGEVSHPVCFSLDLFLNLIWHREGDKGETGAGGRRYSGTLE